MCYVYTRCNRSFPEGSNEFKITNKNSIVLIDFETFEIMTSHENLIDIIYHIFQGCDVRFPN